MKEDTLALMIGGKGNIGRRLGVSPPLHWIPLALVLALVAVILFLPAINKQQDSWLFGFYQSIQGPAELDSRIALVEIEEETVSKYGGWPWDKEQIARLTANIVDGRPLTLALTLDLSPAQSDRLKIGSSSLSSIIKRNSVVAQYSFATVSDSLPAPGTQFILPEVLERSALTVLSSKMNSSLYSRASEPSLPDSSLWSPALGLGFVVPQAKELAWKVPLIAEYGAHIFPGLALEAVRQGLDLPADQIRMVEGIGLVLGNKGFIPLSQGGTLLVRHPHPEQFAIIKAGDILDGKIEKAVFQNRIVFVGLGIGQQALYNTPFAKNRPLVEVWAAAASNILSQRMLQSPLWSPWLAKGYAILQLLVLTILFLYGYSRIWLAGTGLTMMLFFAFLTLIFLMGSNWWLPPALPLITGLLSTVILTISGNSRSNFNREFSVATFNPSMSPKSPSEQLRDPRLVAPSQAHFATKQNENEREAAKVKENAQPDLAKKNSLNAPSKGNSVPDSSQQNAPARYPGVSLQQGLAPAKQALGALATGHPEIERDAAGNLLRLGKYNMVRRLASGAAGEVFEAVDSQMGRTVAIKTLSREASLHFDRVQERFTLEAKAAGALNHPNINTVFDFGTLGTVSFLVLEYVPGQTLSDYMKKNVTPSPALVLTWFEQIASALDYAHQHHIIHRDLKPANLMLNVTGTVVKLLDFGIAKMEDIMLTQTGMTVGTPSYMAPEQLTGSQIVPQSDQYGLAVVIYQLLSRHLPVRASKIPELCRKVLKGEFTPLHESNPELPVSFWPIFQKALSKHPEDRFPTCTHFYLEFRKAVESSKSPGQIS